MYRLIRPLLFWFPAETSHHIAFALLGLIYHVPGASRLMRHFFARCTPALPVTVMGLRFPNPVGLAAGLDKNAQHMQPLSDFGFGWLELGTVTPRPQPGNPPPRLFRIPARHALINRMGFNNVGSEAFLNNLARHGKPCLIGINIGKNKDTPLAQAAEDYLKGLRAAYPSADYVAVNISSPNTAGLRDLQNEENLDELLQTLKAEQALLAKNHGRYVPIALKIAPDVDAAQITAIAELVLKHEFDAVIATNTTITRPGLEKFPVAGETGGLSGRPLKDMSTAVTRQLYARLQGKVPIIGVGGIENADDAWEKLTAGADLVQIYTAFIYDGPSVVQEIVRGLEERVQMSGCRDFTEAVTKTRGHTRNQV